jgi:hypothetical protein
MARKGLILALALTAGYCIQPVKSTTKSVLLLTEMLAPVKPSACCRIPRSRW